MLKVAKIYPAHPGLPYEDHGDDPNFDGDVRMQRAVTSEQSGEVEVLAVYFAAGARTRPHIHQSDQALHFVSGRGVVATADELIETEEGDIVTIPAGVWHWHGSALDSPACHISIRQPRDTNWNVEPGNWAAGYERLKSQR